MCTRRSRTSARELLDGVELGGELRELVVELGQLLLLGRR